MSYLSQQCTNYLLVTRAICSRAAVPNFLAPETSFMEDNFSTDQGEGNGFGMIQAHYIYYALYFYYYYNVIYNEIIIQLTIMQNQWEPWAVFLQLDGPIWGWWETVTAEVCCSCPVYSVISFWLLTLQKTLLHKDRMLEMEAGFSVLLWQFKDIPPWL